jgi:hypothetical protein
MNALPEWDINSKSVWYCHGARSKLSGRNTVKLIQVAECTRTEGNNVTDELTGPGSEYPVVRLHRRFGRCCQKLWCTKLTQTIWNTDV